jgi:DNA polymerase III alpha subunit
MNNSILYEKLENRDLWVDGTESLNVDAMCNEMLSGNYDFLENAFISEDSVKEVKKFINLSNIKVTNNPEVKKKSSIKNLDTSFIIPKEYKTLNLEKTLVKCFKLRHDLSKMSEEEQNDRLYRISDELEIYSNKGLLDVLKCSKYIIDTMKEKNIVWGPGRGSACCSYILFLLEVHDIDSYFFDLSIDEFLR